MIRQPLLALRLLVRFGLHCLLAGLSTARIIVLRLPSEPGFVTLTYAPMSPAGAALLGALITLTPGSSLIDIDTGRRRLLLHLLDRRDAAAALAAIREDFERDVAALFPES